VLQRPLLYLSHFLKRHRVEYYDRLQAVRLDGNWESWLEFFLRGVHEVASEASLTAKRILTLRDNDRVRLEGRGRVTVNDLRTLDLLFEQPTITARWLERRLEVVFATAGKVIDRLTGRGMLRETTGLRRNRRFAYHAYLELFEQSKAADPDGDALPS
jgi:cell filamentation protein, protein adenylyltransferase